MNEIVIRAVNFSNSLKIVIYISHRGVVKDRAGSIRQKNKTNSKNVPKSYPKN